MKDGHCTYVLWLTQNHNYQTGGSEESISPVGNIVTEVRMTVGDEAVDCFDSGSATAVEGDLRDQDMLFAGLQYICMPSTA